MAHFRDERNKPADHMGKCSEHLKSSKPRLSRLRKPQELMVDKYRYFLPLETRADELVLLAKKKNQFRISDCRIDSVDTSERSDV